MQAYSSLQVRVHCIVATHNEWHTSYPVTTRGVEQSSVVQSHATHLARDPKPSMVSTADPDDFVVIAARDASWLAGSQPTNPRQGLDPRPLSMLKEAAAHESWLWWAIR